MNPERLSLWTKLILRKKKHMKQGWWWDLWHSFMIRWILWRHDRLCAHLLFFHYFFLWWWCWFYFLLWIIKNIFPFEFKLNAISDDEKLYFRKRFIYSHSVKVSFLKTKNLKLNFQQEKALRRNSSHAWNLYLFHFILKGRNAKWFSL